jgi:hypothetical protein
VLDPQLPQALNLAKSFGIDVIAGVRHLLGLSPWGRSWLLRRLA